MSYKIKNVHGYNSKKKHWFEIKTVIVYIQKYKLDSKNSNNLLQQCEMICNLLSSVILTKCSSKAQSILFKSYRIGTYISKCN